MSSVVGSQSSTAPGESHRIRVGPTQWVGPVTWHFFEALYPVINANAAGDLGFNLSPGAFAKPAEVTWNEAARFVNWLNTSSGYHPAYKFDADPGDADYSTKAPISM